MGRYYAAGARASPTKCRRAIEEHYRPRFAGDALPVTRPGQALALADKIDTLVGIFAIGEKPTGTKDPFGLRRAALGVLRILIEGRLDLDLLELLEASAAAQPVQRAAASRRKCYDFIAERLARPVARARRRHDARDDRRRAGGAAAPRRSMPTRGCRRSRSSCACPSAGVLTAVNKRIGNILRKAPRRQTRAVEADRVHARTPSGALHARTRRAAPCRRDARAPRRRYGAEPYEPADRACERRSTIFSSTSWSWTRTSSGATNRLALLREAQRCWAASPICRACPG